MNRMTRLKLMPMSDAVSRSRAVARTAAPQVVFWITKYSTTMRRKEIAEDEELQRA